MLTHRRNVRKWNGFHQFGCAISDGENEIAIITELLRTHQVNVETSKPSLKDVDGLWQHTGVAMDIAVSPSTVMTTWRILVSSIPLCL